MARRPFDPAAQGWKKVEYRQGDVLDRASVDELVAGADVVVHLAFIIMAGLDESRAINLQGSRNVFEATVAAGVKRLVYASSVAAYGFHADNPDLLTEDIPPRGTDAHYYSAQKAEVEGVLAEVLDGAATKAYVFRPCVVAGPEALMMIERSPTSRCPSACLRRPGGCSTSCPSSSRSCPTPASRSSSSTTTTSPRRCGPPCSRAASPASTTSPGRAS